MRRTLIQHTALWILLSSAAPLSSAFAQELVEPWGTPDAVFSETAPVWVPYVSGTAKPGSDRSLLYGDFVLPLYQDGQSLLLLEMRGQIDDNDASEFNLGLAYRELLSPGWIFGAYAFWDRLHSANSNSFNQATIGVEAMSFLWDARMNVYLPESGGEFVGPATSMMANGTVVVANGVERAYHGVDIELGALMYSWGDNADHELRGFVDLFYFNSDAPGFQSIAGPRGRLEWRWYDLPCLGNGSRFTCGIEAQYDDVREGQFFGLATLRIPLDPCAWKRPKLNPLQRRMVDPIVRDVDIVSNTTTQYERAVNSRTGRTIDDVVLINGHTTRDTGKSVGELISQAGDNGVVVFSGDAGDIRIPDPSALRQGQTVLGGGSPLAVRGLTTGRGATLWAPGSRPDIIHNTSGQIGGGNGPPRAASC